MRWISRDAMQPTLKARQRTTYVERAVRRERRRMAAELHDGLAQELAGLALLAAALEAESRRGERVSHERLQELQQLLQQAQDRCRELAHEEYASAKLLPSLDAGLRTLARRANATSSLRCVYRCERYRVPLPRKIAHHLFLIAQEAVANAIRHSGGTQIVVELIVAARSVRVVVRDDGLGPSAIGRSSDGGIGCRTMRQRARSLGGTLRIQPAGLSGTEVTAEAPIAVRRRPVPRSRRARASTGACRA